MSTTARTSSSAVVTCRSAARQTCEQCPELLLLRFSWKQQLGGDPRTGDVARLDLPGIRHEAQIEHRVVKDLARMRAPEQVSKARRTLTADPDHRDRQRWCVELTERDPLRSPVQTGSLDVPRNHRLFRERAMDRLRDISGVQVVRFGGVMSEEGHRWFEYTRRAGGSSSWMWRTGNPACPVPGYTGQARLPVLHPPPLRCARPASGPGAAWRRRRRS
ncbi:MAG: hypothetical protein JWO56_639 [Acidobacteria bacterium]|nr:hypothetical protein [Acidobacteriota bacterium]